MPPVGKAYGLLRGVTSRGEERGLKCVGDALPFPVQKDEIYLDHLLLQGT